MAKLLAPERGDAGKIVAVRTGMPAEHPKGKMIGIQTSEMARG